MRRVSIDPVTRVEGHGRVEILLDARGQVDSAFLIVPELRGFERLCVGRPAEEMPGITSRICGLCPEAHLLASVKALDDLFEAPPPDAARKLRELFHCSFVVRDHATHFYVLAGPDLFLDAGTPAAERSFLGVVRRLGAELGKRIIDLRMRNYRVVELLGGRAVHAVAALPGGWSRRLDEEARAEIEAVARENVSFAEDTLALFAQHVLADESRLELLRSGAFADRTHYMGTVDDTNRLNLYDGCIRVVNPDGHQHSRFPAHEYLSFIAERVEPWTYVKLPYLRSPGWHGVVGGADSGVYLTSPLGRLNAADRVATPRAQEALEEWRETLGVPVGAGSRPLVHNRFANHWARLIELLAAAERMLELASDPAITDEHVRTAARPASGEGVGSVEAPRGTLIHHYWTDERGIITAVNLLVGTTNNHAAMALSLTGAARALFGASELPEEALLNRLESVLRSYDPCFSCATHAFPGGGPLQVLVRDSDGGHVRTIVRTP